MSIKYTFLFSNFLIIGLCNSSANSLLTVPPEVFFIKKFIANKHFSKTLLASCCTIKMKHVDAKSNKYIDSGKEINKKDPEFKICDIVRISKYKNIFTKGYTPNWSDEAFLIKIVKNTALWTYVVNNLDGEEIVGAFYEK